MGAWWTMVHVKHKNSNDYREGDKDHGEEQVLPNQWNHQRRRGNDFGDEQQENSEGKEDGNTQRDLLSAVWRQVEHQHGQTRNEQAGNDEVDGVEQRQTADDEEVGDVRVDLMTTVVFLCVVGSHSIDDGPFAALPVVLQVHGALDLLQIYLGLVVGPGAELHLAVLLVEREERDVNAAGALVDGWRNPTHLSSVEEVGFGHVGHRKLTVRTVHKTTWGYSTIQSFGLCKICILCFWKSCMITKAAFFIFTSYLIM